jgi:hypothetical protein
MARLKSRLVARHAWGVLLAVVVATLCAYGVGSVEAKATIPQAADTVLEMEPQLTPGKCKVYRTYYRTIVGPAAPLRWGKTDPSGFGLRHIRENHRFESRRIDWVLHNGRVIEQRGSTIIVQGQYPGDRNPFRVVYADNWNSNHCPGELLGIITAYRRTR